MRKTGQERPVCLRAIRHSMCGLMLFGFAGRHWRGIDPWQSVAPWTDDVSETTCADCLRVVQPGLL